MIHKKLFVLAFLLIPFLSYSQIIQDAEYYMSIGMGPSIKIDFNAPPGERVQFPIGLGITKTSKIGKTPIKWRIEPQYTIVRPESLGTTWTLRFQIAPIVRNPFM